MVREDARVDEGAMDFALRRRPVRSIISGGDGDEARKNRLLS